MPRYERRTIGFHFLTGSQGILKTGTSTAPMSITTTPPISLWTTTDDTTGTIQSFNVKLVETATAVGGATIKGANVLVQSDTRLGGLCYAIHGKIDFNDTGSVHGLAAGISSEVELPNSSLIRGAIYASELKIVAQTSSSWGSAGPVAFMRVRSSGAGVAQINSNAYFMIFYGHTGAAGKLVSATSQTVKCSFSGEADPTTTVRHLFFSQLADGIGLGASGAYQSITAAGDHGILAYLTTPATTGNVYPIEFYVRNSASGINNFRAAFFHLTMAANCAGPYALYATTDCGAYQVTGLGSAFGLELIMPGAPITSGQFHGMTIDLACPASWSGGAASGYHSFIKLETWGDTKANWDTIGNMFYINGPTAGAGKLISLTSQTARVYAGTNARYLFMGQLEDGIGLGANGTPMVVTAAGDHALLAYTTTPATTGNVQPFEIFHTNTGAVVNSRAFCVTNTAGANVSGPYAMYARTDMVGFQTLGLCAAFGTEVCLPGATITSGEYHNITLDFECAASGAGFGDGTGKHSFIKFEIWGDTTAKNNFDDGFNLFYLNGMSAGDASLFSTNPNDKTNGAVNATLRINISGTPYYIPLWDNYDGT